MSNLLVVARDRIRIVSQGGKQGLPGIAGPQGKPGAPGGTTLEYPAGIAIGGHRVVTLNAAGKLVYASAADLSHMGRVVGITLGAVDVDADCRVQNFDQIEEPSWAWDASKPVYLGIDGLLTQQAPALPESKFSMVVGFPISSTVLLVNLREPIVLTA